MSPKDETVEGAVVAADDWAPLEWPGNLHLVSSRGTVFTGCKVAFIKGTGQQLAEGMNAYFAGIGRGCLYVGEVVLPDGLLIYWTKKVTDEKLEIIESLQLKIDEMVADVMKARAASMEAEELQRITDEETRRTLIEAGVNCRKNHAGLVKEQRAERRAKKGDRRG